MKTRNKILLGLGIIALIIIILILLCYFFAWPFPVFCCLFHNWCNHNILNTNITDWQCNHTQGGDGIPSYTCGTSQYPQCEGTCPPGQVCAEFYHTATAEVGCECVTAEPETYDCGDKTFPYCEDGTCPTGQWCQGVYDETGPHCECSTECSDTDGYADIREYGICTDFLDTYADECLPDGTLLEYWCENHYCNWDVYECGAGYYCENGECKPIPNCNLECANAGYPGGYWSGGISCDDFEHYIPSVQCCCYLLG